MELAKSSLSRLQVDLDCAPRFAARLGNALKTLELLSVER